MSDVHFEKSSLQFNTQEKVYFRKVNMQSENLELPFDADCPNCVKEWIGDCDHHFMKNFLTTYAEKSDSERIEDLYSESIYKEWISLGKSFWLNEVSLERFCNICCVSLVQKIMQMKEQIVQMHKEKTEKCKKERVTKLKAVRICKAKANKLKKATLKNSVKMKLSFLKSILKKSPTVPSSKPAKLDSAVSKPEETTAVKKSCPKTKKSKPKRTKVKCDSGEKKESQSNTVNPDKSENDRCSSDLNEPKERLCLQDIKNIDVYTERKRRERKQVLKELEVQESFAKVVLNREKKFSGKKQRNTENKENCLVNKLNCVPSLIENDERRPLILRRNCNKKTDTVTN